jgi:hypothetical protein
MALMKGIEVNETGVEAAYWRLTHLQLDRVAGILEATLHGYRDEAARRDGRQPLSRAVFRFPAESLGADALALDGIYDAIRREPSGRDERGRPVPSAFADAADI